MHSKKRKTEPTSSLLSSERAELVEIDHGSLAKVATCNLNMWAMDFDNNLRLIQESVKQAKAQGCTVRTGPELEISGYGCADHFLEQDTVMHSWESVGILLQSGLTNGILVDVGMPVIHQSVRYNCRVFILDGKVILIRPKVCMADDGIYRETRWFCAWTSLYELQQHILPPTIYRITGQRSVPFGVAIIEANDGTVAAETCEELFTPQALHIGLGLNGAEIILNGSGSHHTLRKLNQRLELIKGATAKSGGVYLYANQQGCDGDRVYYDGCASVFVNGQCVAMGKQFSVLDIEIVTAVVDLEDVRSFRGVAPSRARQATSAARFPRVRVDFNLCTAGRVVPSPQIEIKLHLPEEEIAFGPACWLWDYLRRSGSTGFFLPLSGGADSSSTAAIVGAMCTLVFQACQKGDPQVLSDVRRILGRAQDSGYVPRSREELAHAILHTCYMGTSNSSTETKERAENLSKEIGNYHVNANIDHMVSAVLFVFQQITGKTPKYKVHGGSIPENLALQNIQARLRMVLSYLMAQLLPWVRGQAGWLLVLGSANVDEALRGYMTKYDCSSADINPIGSVSKTDLKTFLHWAAREDTLNYPTLKTVVQAPPTAELEPITADYKQADEEDMGMSYADLSLYGRLRKVARCGPVSMYNKLVHIWPTLPVEEVAAKVKKFFFYYSTNRHKMTTVTPAYHAENYSPDDNRFDHRQFLYNVKWTRQFKHMDVLVAAGRQGSAGNSLSKL